jgi:triacylglycerol lipase
MMRTAAILCALAAVPGCVADDPEYQPDEGKDDIDACKLERRYTNGVCDRTSLAGFACKQHDPECPLLGPDPSHSVTQFPIILHHGFAGGNDGIWAWLDVADALGNDGNVVVQTEVPPFGSLDARAAELARWIEQTLADTGAAKVNIIAHSYGGLDARWVISKFPELDGKIASLTTISSPHRGTYIADLGLGLLPEFTAPVVNAAAELIGKMFNANSTSADVRAAFNALKVEGADARNAQFAEGETVDANGFAENGVLYQSWAGVANVTGSPQDVTAVCEGNVMITPNTYDHLWPGLALISPVIGRDGDVHDGMATVKSAKWGKFRGCIPTDHRDEIGQVTSRIGGVITSPSMTTNPLTDWDHVRFYRQVVDGLAAQGL